MSQSSSKGGKTIDAMNYKNIYAADFKMTLAFFSNGKSGSGNFSFKILEVGGE